MLLQYSQYSYYSKKKKKAWDRLHFFRIILLRFSHFILHEIVSLLLRKIWVDNKRVINQNLCIVNNILLGNIIIELLPNYMMYIYVYQGVLVICYEIIEYNSLETSIE